jgi:SAM-dependent methyltransferase
VVDLAPEVSEKEIREGLERLAPFHHSVGLPHGLTTPLADVFPWSKTRVPNLVAHAWPALIESCGGSLEGLRVLDVACNCGGFSIEAVKGGAEYVLGIDVVDRYLEQANFLRRALRMDNLEFRNLAVENLDPADVGTFDVCLNFGLLYHLENPLLAMRRLSAVTKWIMVVDTRLDPTRPEEPYWRMNFKEAVPEDSASPTDLFASEGLFQFTPTFRAVEELLQNLGFPKVKRLEPGPDLEERYYKGRRGTVIAARR